MTKDTTLAVVLIWAMATKIWMTAAKLWPTLLESSRIALLIVFMLAPMPTTSVTEAYKQDFDGGVMQLCKGVTWSYNMAANNASNHANCWLKNGTSTGYQCNSCISGKLV